MEKEGEEKYVSFVLCSGNTGSLEVCLMMWVLLFTGKFMACGHCGICSMDKIIFICANHVGCPSIICSSCRCLETGTVLLLLAKPGNVTHLVNMQLPDGRRFRQPSRDLSTSYITL